MNSETQLPKKTLRRSLLNMRDALPPDEKSRLDAAIGARVADWFRQHPVPTLGVYWPIRSEPDLHDLYAGLVAQGVALALPVVTAKDHPLAFASWAPGDALDKDAMGIAVPARIEQVAAPDALLIPCVGFNDMNVRLGYGGGFYDRTLASAPRPMAVGIAYECARADFVSDPHDISMDVIITERSLIRRA